MANFTCNVDTKTGKMDVSVDGKKLNEEVMQVSMYKYGELMDVQITLQTYDDNSGISITTTYYAMSSAEGQKIARESHITHPDLPGFVGQQSPEKVVSNLSNYFNHLLQH